jgi:polyhydroxyalkanoate synthesis regulator phasin
MVDKNLDNLEDLRKLSPEERIRILKELEEKRKKELLEAEKLIEQSVAEIKAEEKLKEEIEEEERKQRQSSKLKKIDDTNLEGKVQKEKQMLVDEELSNNKQYQIKLSMEPITNLYDRLRDVYQQVVENGEMTNEQERQIRDLGYAMQHKSDAIDHGEYKTAGEQIEDIISASKSILNYMRRGT